MLMLKKAGKIRSSRAPAGVSVKGSIGTSEPCDAMLHGGFDVLLPCRASSPPNLNRAGQQRVRPHRNSPFPVIL